VRHAVEDLAKVEEELFDVAEEEIT